MPGAAPPLEYPIHGAWSDGQLASGYIDLVSVDGRIDIIDFKTDTPSTGPVEKTYPKYAAQVRTYGSLLKTAGILKDRHAALRFVVHCRRRNPIYLVLGCVSFSRNRLSIAGLAVAPVVVAAATDVED